MNTIDLLNSLTLEQKIGQLMMIGYHNQDELLSAIKTYGFGNFILFTRNIDMNFLKDNIKEIKKTCIEYNKVLPFISIDQEGGKVCRIQQKITFPPGAMTIAATDISNAYKVGEIIGMELSSYGINMNLAPCLDITTDKLINLRNYSNDIYKVSKYASKVIDGLNKYVIAVAKHFPGKGESEVDSHFDLPKITATKNELLKRNLYPFIQVLDKTKVIMVSHAMYTNLDQELPSSLSKKIITDLLKNELNFNGLIISDCMEMKAIDDYFADSIIEGIKNGLDIILVSHTFEKQLKIRNALVNAVSNNEISIDLINQKVLKILELKNNIKDDYVLTENQLKKNIDFAFKVVFDSFTLIKGNLINLDKNTFIICDTNKIKSIGEENYESRNLLEIIHNEFKFLKQSNEFSSNEFKKILLFVSSDASEKMISEFQNDNLYVISFKGPLKKEISSQVKDLACFYEFTPNAIKACIQYLKNNLELKGINPII